MADTDREELLLRKIERLREERDELQSLIERALEYRIDDGWLKAARATIKRWKEAKGATS